MDFGLGSSAPIRYCRACRSAAPPGQRAASSPTDGAVIDCPSSGVWERGMRISVFAALVAGPLMLAGSALAFSQRDWDECQASDLDRRIAGCSGIIDDRGATGKSRAVAFNKRGLASPPK